MSEQYSFIPKRHVDFLILLWAVRLIVFIGSLIKTARLEKLIQNS